MEARASGRPTCPQGAAKGVVWIRPSSFQQQFRCLVYEFAGFAVQGTGDLENHDKVGQVFAALDLAHVRALDLGQVGQFFLSQTQLEPPLAHDLPKSNGRCRFERGGTAGAAGLDFSRLHDWQLRVQSSFRPRYI